MLVRTVDGRSVFIGPRDAEEASAAMVTRLKIEGSSGLQRLESPLREAFEAALRARGALLR